MTGETLTSPVEVSQKKSWFKREWIWILVVYLVLRLTISALGAVTVAGKGLAVPSWIGPADIGYQRLVAISTDPNPATRYLLAGWLRWDTGWFIQVAETGYSVGEGITSFLPLYPALIRLVELVTGGNGILAALVVSNILCIVALILFYEVARMELGPDGDARMAVLYLVTFPAAFFLFIGYSESLFLTLSLAAWLCARHRRWLFAAAAGGLAVLTRLQGITLVVPLGWLALVTVFHVEDLSPRAEVRAVLGALRRKDGWRRLLASWRHPAWIAALAPFLCFGLFNLVLKLAGVVTPLGGYASRSSGLVFPWQAVGEFVQRLATYNLTVSDTVDLAVLVLFLVVTVIGFPKIRPALSLLSLAILLIVFSRSYQTTLLSGFMRFVLTTFPFFLVLAKWNMSRPIRALILPVFMLTQLLLIWVFINWGWVA